MRMSSGFVVRFLRGGTTSMSCAVARQYCSYKSAISLDKLYPQSSLSICKTAAVPQNESTKFSGYIPMEKLEITYSRGSGPGGQNVNKVSTKATIRFKIDEAMWIPDIVRNNMKEKFRNHLTKDGYIGTQSDRTRHQHLNTADALEKIREMIRASEPEELAAPSPETLEKLRRKREKAARERLLLKRSRSDVKSHRGSV